MVLRGQFLERPTLIASPHGVLEGLWHRGSRHPPCLVLPPGPNAGGGMDHVVAAELVWALVREGHPTLRFNFRGVGASPGERGDARARAEDAEAALELLLENTEAEEVAVFALEEADEVVYLLAERRKEVGGIGLVHPSASAGRLGALSRRLLVISSEEAARSSQQTLAELESCGARVEVIGGSDRAFLQRLSDVGQIASQWIQALDERGAG